MIIFLNNHLQGVAPYSYAVFIPMFFKNIFLAAFISLSISNLHLLHLYTSELPKFLCKFPHLLHSFDVKCYVTTLKLLPLDLHISFSFSLNV